MKKKLTALLVAGVLAVALAVPAYAAITDSQKKEITDLYSQIAGLRKQLVQKYVDDGVITKAQGDTMKQNIDQAEKYQEQNAGTFVPGTGCGGVGCGGLGCGAGFGGRGRGLGAGAGAGAGAGMMRGYYNNTNAGTSGQSL